MGLFGKKKIDKPLILEETDFNKKANALKNKSNFTKKDKQASINANQKEIEVKGTCYCKPKLKCAKRMKLTLTPKNHCQTTKGWPEGSIANVNTYGALKTNDSNFIGYIRQADSPKLFREVRDKGYADVIARIERDKGVYRVYILE